MVWNLAKSLVIPNESEKMYSQIFAAPMDAAYNENFLNFAA